MMGTTVPGFERLSDNIAIQRAPSNAPSPPSPGQPSLIVYCSWMGAAPKYIAKYTAGYRQHFPGATILLVQCGLAGMFFAPDLEPAADVIAAHLDDGRGGSVTGKSGAVLLWAMASNGGSIMAVRLAELLRQRHALSPLPVHALVLDCAPGLPDFDVGARAISLNLPLSNPLMRALGYYVVYAMLMLWVAASFLFSGEDVVSRLRRELGPGKAFPAVTPRLYLYSKADAMVPWRGVHAHVETARAEGCRDVREEVFERAPHCALLSEDGERYWAAVRAILTRS